MRRSVSLVVNAEARQTWAEPWHSLAEVLREHFAMTGTKIACNTGGCGACTVLLDGTPVRSCLVLAPEADGSSVQTIEGLADGDALHPLQTAFVEHFASQCGFCSAGMIMTALALLRDNPDATEEQIRSGLYNNLCRCTGYVKIVEAVMSAALRMSADARGERSRPP